MSKEEFVQQTYAAAMGSLARSGMPALVTVAQAALESNWGQSRLSREAHNYFGLKAHGRHDRIQMHTTEFVRGSRVEEHAEFAKYQSLEDCIACRDAILSHSARYADVRKACGDETAFIREIAVHWATDPRYAEKLQAVLNEVKGILHECSGVAAEKWK
jgi:flagellum-specific peptidoglycan hydrolase FlgJ